MQETDPHNSNPDHDPWDTIGDVDVARSEPGSVTPVLIPKTGFTDSGSDGEFGRALAVIERPFESQPVAGAPVPPVSTYCGSGWTIPLLCLGLGLIACCVLIPQADTNRRLAYEKQMLQADLASVKQQAKINGIFLKRVADDPALAERLAERQMKMIRAGSKVLPLDGTPAAAGGGDMSPFQITEVAPPPPAPPYEPIGGPLATICYNPHCRLYLIGAALLAIAAGLVLGQGLNRV
jgi:hypothetical protein